MACLFASNVMLLAAFWGVAGGAPFLSASMVVHACGTLALSVLWIDLYARLNPIRAAFLNAVAVVVSQLFIFFTEENSIQRVFWMLLLLLAMTCVCYIAASRKSEQGGGVARPAFSERGERFPVPYTAVAFIAACSFAYGIATMMTPDVGARYTSVVPSLIVIAFILVDTKRFDMSLLLRIALPLLVGGFLLVAFVTGTHAVSSAVLNTGFAAIEMLLLLMVCTVSYSTGASAIWLFGVLSAAQFGMRYLGSLLGRVLSGSGDPAGYLVLCVVAIVVVVVSGALLMSEKNVFAFWEGRRAREESGEDGADRVKARVESLASVYALTDREREALHLVMQGKTNVAIAHDMFISEGTVKAHLHHIYQKLGVHTRKELTALVESEGGTHDGE